MGVIVKDKSALERGFTCDACKQAVQPTAAYRTTCPHCRQVYVAEARS